MALAPLFLLLLYPLHSLPFPALSLTYYQTSCPSFAQIVQTIVISKQITSPTTAATTLRLFHDCLVLGVDASILVSCTPFNNAFALVPCLESRYPRRRERGRRSGRRRRGRGREGEPGVVQRESNEGEYVVFCHYFSSIW